MLAAFGAKPVAEPDEAPGLGSGGRVQHLDQRALDNLVFQRGDAEWALPPVGLRDEPTPRRLRPIGSSVDSAVQVLEADLEVTAVILPRHAIDARSRLALERQVGFPELIAIDVVQERGEPFLLLQPCALPYAFQAVGRAVPARCPGRAVLLRVLLGPRPWLHELLRRSPGLVRSLHSDSWRSLTPRPRASSASARRLPDADCSPPGLTRGSRSPGFRSRSFRTCQGLRPRRTGRALALARTPVLPSAHDNGVGVPIDSFAAVAVGTGISPCPPHRSRRAGFPAPGSCRRSGAIGRARRLFRSADPQAGDGYRMPGPVLRPEHRQSSTIPPTEPPSLHALRRRSSRPCSGASPVLRGSSDSSPVPRQLRLLAFLPRPGIATATAGQTRSSQVPTRSFRA